MEAKTRRLTTTIYCNVAKRDFARMNYTKHDVKGRDKEWRA
jgi:hypothetical protein